jgi:hypothetical protein
MNAEGESDRDARAKRLKFRRKHVPGWKAADSRRHTCTRKYRYGSKQEALRSGPRGHCLHAYRCPFCGEWHLTSREQRA